VIDITSPVNNSFVKGAVSVDANITEANTAAVNVTIDGILFSSSLPAAWDTTIYPDVPHAAGVYVIDTADNTAATSVSVTVDNTPPASLYRFAFKDAHGVGSISPAPARKYIKKEIKLMLLIEMESCTLLPPLQIHAPQATPPHLRSSAFICGFF
ncbi:MAG: hypothetical protein KAH86_03095, partial [Methanosarcinales archaeon]|nr:hypothetical protein [Methanosarcinales archaeon]